MAQKLVETENIEFLVLVQRMQDINKRLENDTAKLKATKQSEDAKIEEAGDTLKRTRDRNLNIRRDVKAEKKDWIEKKTAALKKFEDQRLSFGKLLAFQQ